VRLTSSITEQTQGRKHPREMAREIEKENQHVIALDANNT